MPSADSIASASSVDLPAPATPWTTSAPPEPVRAASTRAAIVARSESLPASTRQRLLRAAAARRNTGNTTGVSRPTIRERVR